MNDRPHNCYCDPPCETIAYCLAADGCRLWSFVGFVVGLIVGVILGVSR